MVDELDRASEYEDIARNRMIEESSRKASIPVHKSKKCLNCGEATKNGARWCSKECQDDYLKRIKR